MTELAAALARWQHAAGPYWPFVCAAPFLGETPRPRSATPRPSSLARRLVEVLSARPDQSRAAIFVDLPPARALPATPDLIGRGFVVVPIVQRWVTSPAVLNCQSLVDGLAYYGLRARRPRCEQGVVFLLDGERAGAADASRTLARSFDNRYAYSTSRFPPLAFLRSRGIGRIGWIGRSAMAPDLASYLPVAPARLPSDGWRPDPNDQARPETLASLWMPLADGEPCAGS